MNLNGFKFTQLFCIIFIIFNQYACGQNIETQNNNDNVEVEFLDERPSKSKNTQKEHKAKEQQEEIDTTYEDRENRIQVNGTSIFYKVKGKGKPVIIQHGNSGSHRDLDVLQNVLSQNGYKVYALDSRGQGANPPLKEYHYKDMAEDVYQFIQKLKLKKPAVYGWSDGGNNALLMEVMHPGTCGIIITSGANLFPAGWGGEANIRRLKASHPHPVPLFKMLLEEPNMTFEDMKKIKCPSLICAGQSDIILESHTRGIADHIPNGELKIVKGASHTSYVKHSKVIADIVLSFLKKNNY